MAINTGWIKLHRSIQDHWLFNEKREFSKFEAWIDLLLTVNHDESKSLIKNMLITCERGQSILSLDSWAKRWRWNKSAVRRYFQLLEKDGMIKTESVSKTTRLTICNYESYQAMRNDDETMMKRSWNDDETMMKRRRNGVETELTPIKECKELKNVKNVKNDKKDIYTHSENFENSLQQVIDPNISLSPKKEKSSAKKEKNFGKEDFRQTLLDLGCDPQHVNDWILAREKKRGVFTATALQAIFTECKIHQYPIEDAVRHCAEKGWIGFKYDWILNEQKNERNQFTSNKPTNGASEVSDLRRFAESVIRNNNI